MNNNTEKSVKIAGRALTTFEAAEICGVHHRTISRWVRNGFLKAFETPGGHLRIPEEDLKEFIASGKMKARRKNSERLKVLVIDDEESFRDSVVRFLGKEEHFDVREAQDGYAAGRVLGSFKPDVVLLDLLMPGLNGFEVCRDLRNSPEFDGTKIIVITGFGNKKNIERAYTCGADLCLQKPVELDDLKTEILKLIPSEILKKL